MGAGSIVPTNFTPIPIDRLPISAASGLVELRGTLWTVADDETFLVGSTSIGVWDRRIALVPDRLPLDPAERKRRKPDFESLAILPDGRLLVLGSGSTAARRRGVVVDVRRQTADLVDLTPLHRALESAFPALNLEGAVVHGESLFLAQRGNAARTFTPIPNRGSLEAPAPRSANALVRLDLARSLASMARSELGAESIEAILPVELPELENVPLGLTDLASDGVDLHFAAAAEDSASTYHDGACVGSVIGRLSSEGRVTALRGLTGRAKIEGLWLGRSERGVVQALLVADPDDRAVEARLFRIAPFALD